ncbi:MAG: phytanoyl-CoA dioxygenase family protein [Bacteroidetes bacterium]|nr:phytanoyl-CoA dioxygenase family protein [Bacteroidota bacterium]
MFEFPKNNRPILIDESKQQQFDKLGYCIIPLLKEGDLIKYNKLYGDIHSVDSKGFFPSTYSNNKEYRKEISIQLKSATHDLLPNHFKDYKVFTGNFIIKHQGKGTELGLHQDMTLVDESQYIGINVWCPLCDITKDNGAIWFLEGSNRIFSTYRGPSIPNIYDKFPEDIMQCMTPIYLKAGEAIVFDHSILHFSPPNLSNKDRVAFNIFIAHKDATVVTAYYEKNSGKNQVELFQQEDTFFLEYEQFDENKFERPKIGKSMGQTEYTFPFINLTVLKEKYNYKPKQENKIATIFSNLKNVFSK